MEPYLSDRAPYGDDRIRAKQLEREGTQNFWIKKIKMKTILICLVVIAIAAIVSGGNFSLKKFVQNN